MINGCFRCQKLQHEMERKKQGQQSRCGLGRGLGRWTLMLGAGVGERWTKETAVGDDNLC